MHQISVIGDTEDILADLKLPEDVKLKVTENKVVFISENNETIKETKEILANAISEIILKKYNNKFINYVLKNEGFLPDDALLLMDERAEEGKRIIKNELQKFLICNDVISVDGFRKFRLRKYESFFKKCIEEYEDSFSFVRETDELLYLLKIYVESRPKLEKTIQIFPQKHGGYILKNDDNVDITEKCINEFINFKRFSEMSFDDILLSSLIIMSPGKIVIHTPEKIKSPELRIVLEKIFHNKLLLCTDCALCRENNKI